MAVSEYEWQRGSKQVSGSHFATMQQMQQSIQTNLLPIQLLVSSSKNNYIYIKDRG